MIAFLTGVTITATIIGLGFCFATWLGVRQTERQMRELRAKAKR